MKYEISNLVLQLIENAIVSVRGIIVCKHANNNVDNVVQGGACQ